MLLDIFTGHALPGEYAFMAFCIWAAWMLGKAVAEDWKGLLPLIVYSLLLGAGARFLHFALYEAPFLSFSRYAIDTVILVVTAIIGFRFTRTNMMTSQYHWLYEKANALSWRKRA